MHTLGMHADAVRSMKEALAINVELNKQEDVVMNLHNLASIYDAIGEYSLAEDCYQQARKIIESAKHPAADSAR